MIPFLFLFLVILCIGMSLRTLFLPEAMIDKFLSWRSFVYLLFMYVTAVIGFGLIYFLLMQNGYAVLAETGTKAGEPEGLDLLFTCVYFSGITMFSIGYGDVVPLGIGRLIAVIEGLLGYAISASFVFRTVADIRKRRSLG